MLVQAAKGAQAKAALGIFCNLTVLEENLLAMWQHQGNPHQYPYLHPYLYPCLYPYL